MSRTGDAGSARTVNQSESYTGSDNDRESISPNSRSSSPGSVSSRSRNTSLYSVRSGKSATRPAHTVNPEFLNHAPETPSNLPPQNELMLCKVYLRGYIEIPTKDNKKDPTKPYGMSNATYKICEQLLGNPYTLTNAPHPILDIFGASYNDATGKKWLFTVIHVMAIDYKSVPYTGIICTIDTPPTHIYDRYDHHFRINKGYIGESLEWGKMPPPTICKYNGNNEPDMCYPWK